MIRVSSSSSFSWSQALLQTVDREQREMKELDSARDRLLSLCTAGGQDSLTLEVSHLHDLCAVSEQEVRERLSACEAQLEELDRQLARRAAGLKERAAALQWELRSLDQALSYSEPQNNMAQLQQHWHSLQVVSALYSTSHSDMREYYFYFISFYTNIFKNEPLQTGQYYSCVVFTSY